MTEREKKKSKKYISELDQISTIQTRGKLVHFHETDPPTCISTNLAVILSFQTGRPSVSAIQKHLLSYSQYGQAWTIAWKILFSRNLSSHAPDDELPCPCCAEAVRTCLKTTLVLLQAWNLKELQISAEIPNSRSMGIRKTTGLSKRYAALWIDMYEFHHFTSLWKSQFDWSLRGKSSTRSSSFDSDIWLGRPWQRLESGTI